MKGRYRLGSYGTTITLNRTEQHESERVASPFVVFECVEASSVAGSSPFDEASGDATAGGSARCS